MKGTPETPQCGFSRASIQILGLQGVDPKKFIAFNVLEDPQLRQGKYWLIAHHSKTMIESVQIIVCFLFW
jgi:glutaredoxin-related protein